MRSRTLRKEKHFLLDQNSSDSIVWHLLFQGAFTYSSIHTTSLTNYVHDNTPVAESCDYQWNHNRTYRSVTAFAKLLK